MKASTGWQRIAINVGIAAIGGIVGYLSGHSPELQGGITSLVIVVLKLAQQYLESLNVPDAP